MGWGSWESQILKARDPHARWGGREDHDREHMILHRMFGCVSLFICTVTPNVSVNTCDSMRAQMFWIVKRAELETISMVGNGSCNIPFWEVRSNRYRLQIKGTGNGL